MSQERLPYILTQTVPGLGMRGTIVYFHPFLGNKYIIHKRYGVLATLDTLAKYYYPPHVKLERVLKKAVRHFGKSAAELDLKKRLILITLRRRKAKRRFRRRFSSISRRKQEQQLQKQLQQQLSESDTSTFCQLYRVTTTTPRLHQAQPSVTTSPPVSPSVSVSLWGLFSDLSLQHEIDLLSIDIKNCLFVPSTSDEPATPCTVQPDDTIRMPATAGQLIIFLKPHVLPKTVWTEWDHPPGILFEFR